MLDPHDGDGAAARVRVSGLPVVAPVMSVDARDGLRLALVALLGIGALVLLVLTRQLVVLGPALATVLSMSVLGFSGALGSSSAPVFLLAPVLTFAAAGGPASTSLRTAFLVALGAASLSLLAAGLLPVTHLALALAFSFGISAAAAHLVPPRPRK